MVWVLDHTRDLMADFRVFYRLSWSEALALPGPEFLALAYRASAFQGVMALREQEEAVRQARTKPARGVRQVEPTREAVQTDPLLAAAISFN